MIIKLDQEKVKAAAEEGDKIAGVLIDYETQEIEIKEVRQKGLFFIPGKIATLQGDKKSLERFMDESGIN